MEPESLKSAWKVMSGENKNAKELKRMLSENRHPVLKGIRLQLLIEMTAWTFFLLFYYDFFDGDRKPFYLNLLLVAAVVLLLLHSFTGYLSAKNLVKGNDLKQSLLNYLSRLKMYAVVSVSSRIFTIICLLIFFIATINFTPGKYLLLTCAILLIPLQAFFLSRIWNKRIKQLKTAINGLNE